MTDLPEGWLNSKIGDVGSYQNGFAFNSKTWSDSGRPIIRIQNLTGSGSTFNYFDGEIEDRYVVQPGDLLFSWSATLGVYRWGGPEAVLNQHIFKVTSSVDTRFHEHLLAHVIAQMMSQVHGTGMVHITKKKFEALPVPVPDSDEQREIVRILDTQLARIDIVLRSVQAVRDKADQFRRSLLHAAFAGQLTQPDPSRGDALAEGWGVARLDEVAMFSVRAPKQEGCADAELTFLPMAAVKEISGEIDRSQTILASEGKRRNLTYMENGDVIFAKITPCMENGKIAVVDGLVGGRAYGSTEFHVLRPTGQVEPSYLWYFLIRDDFRWEAERAMTGAVGQRRVPRKYLEACVIPVPERDEREEIVRILETQLARLDAAVVAADRVEVECGRLRRSLLQAAFTGELTRKWRESRG